MVDFGFAGILFLAPWFFGGRHDLGRLLFVVLAGVTATAWFIHQLLGDEPRWTRCALHGVAVAATLIVALQLVPLPPAALNWLTPSTAELLPVWSGSDGVNAQPVVTHLGQWRTISLTPADTRIALAMCIAYALLFVTAVQRLRNVDDVTRLLRGIAVAAVLMAVFGLLQHALSNGLFFWFYEVPARSPDRSPSGAFTNRNHFAQFLALSIGPLAAWFFTHYRAGASSAAPRSSGRRRRTPPLAIWKATGLAVALAVVMYAALATMSRGGAAALAVATFVVILGCWRHSIVSTGSVLAAGVFGFVVIGMLSLFGDYDAVATRLDDYTAGSIDELDSSGARRKVWSANLSAFRSAWLTGSGAGSHAEIYPLHLPESLPIEFTHAENGYLQIISENGLPGAVLLALALVGLSYYGARALFRATDRNSALCATAAVAGLCASAVHSVSDFVWYIPACLSFTLLLAACVVRLAQLNLGEKPRVAVSRSTWTALTAAVAIAGGWAILTLIGPGRAAAHWDAYRVISRARGVEIAHMLRTNTPELRAKSLANCATFDQAMITELLTTVEHHPNHARAHLRLGAIYLRRFDALQQNAENVMFARQVRDTAIDSKFEDREQLIGWLKRAFGENADLLGRAHWHTRRAAALSPLEGDAYLQLAKTCFLDGYGLQTIDELVNQAVTVRPHDGDILFEAGERHRIQNRPEVAARLWAAAFRDRGPHRLRMIEHVCDQLQLPSSTFLSMFQPDWQTLADVWHCYAAPGSRDDDLEVLVEYGRRQAELDERNEHPTAAYHWLRLSRFHGYLKQPDQALACAARAARLAPNVYSLRRAHALALNEAGFRDEAAAELRWCLARHGDDAAVERALAAALRTAPTPSERAAARLAPMTAR